jgi:hypothetical protein
MTSATLRTMETTHIDQDPDGLAAWRASMEQMPTLLRQLLAAPPALYVDCDRLPDMPGVYLYTRGDRAMMSGYARNLDLDLAAENAPTGRWRISRVAYQLGRKEALRAARAAGDTEMQYLRRAEVEARGRAWEAHFAEGRELATTVELRVLPVEDFIVGQLLAFYAELTLGAAVVFPSKHD